MHRASGVAHATLRLVRGGGVIEDLERARALSRATGGAVPVNALWGPAVRGEAYVASEAQQ